MMATAGKDTPEYKKLFAVQAELADALGDHDGVALRLANKLLEMGVIGKAIRDAADIRGPHVTEIMRVNPIIKAMLSNIDLNPTMRYQEFRNALLAPAVGVPPDVVNKYLPAGTLIATVDSIVVHDSSLVPRLTRGHSAIARSVCMARRP